MTEDVPVAKDVAWEVEKALTRYVASCSQAEQSLPAVQFINNRADEIAAELVKATATPTSPDLVEALKEARSKLQWFLSHRVQTGQTAAGFATSEIIKKIDDALAKAGAE